MVFSRVAANCTNKSSLKDGISLYTIPYFNVRQTEAKRRRKLWVGFVKAKRIFEPTKASTIFSPNFKPDDFETIFCFTRPVETKLPKVKNG